MQLSTLNNVLTLCFTVLGAIGAVLAFRANYVSHERANVLTRRAAAFGLVAAALGLTVFFVGLRVEHDNESTIKSLKGRDPSPAQIEKLIGLLKSAPKSTNHIEVYGPPGVREGIHVATVLKNALLSAGFNAVGVIEDAPIGGAGPGILVRQNGNTSPVGAGIAAALNASGFEARYFDYPENGPRNGVVEIYASYAP
jgi:hypothetical protein